MIVSDHKRTQVKILVKYPVPPGGRLVLRTSQDWDRDVPATRSDEEQTRWSFRVEHDEPCFYFKACLVLDDGFHWARGGNCLAIAGGPVQTIFPTFFYEGGTFSREPELYQDARGDTFRVRVYHPPGYHENYLEQYPVLYMHDGHNLFFPREAFTGSTWKVSETLETLDLMNAVRKTIVVGIYPEERMEQYTLPGYKAYGDFIVNHLIPDLEPGLRSDPGPDKRAVMGSSLGGVASFYLAWQYPEVFGCAACLSSTFGYRDDLMHRVRTEKKRKLRIYLDSGWPGDNYEVTRAMADTLLSRGYGKGSQDLLYLAFPQARHTERDWASRCHIPLQFLFPDNQHLSKRILPKRMEKK